MGRKVESSFTSSFHSSVGIRNSFPQLDLQLDRWTKGARHSANGKSGETGPIFAACLVMTRHDQSEDDEDW